MYYILGLLFTDGNLDREEKKITLSLTNKDIIEFLYPYFYDTNKRKIYEYQPKREKAKRAYTIINTNESTINHLKEMTLTPCNSLTKSFPNIPKKYMNSFLRGVFDGDGCIFVANKKYNKEYKKLTITCGSEKFVNGLKTAFNSIGITPTIVWDINKQKDIINFYNYIYSNAKCYIKYKKQRFE